MLYSQTTGGFYLPAIHGDNIPADAIIISDEEHASLLQGHGLGKSIVPDLNGKPVSVDQPKPTREKQIVQYAALVNNRLDEFARTRGYDNILSACTYAVSEVSQFSAEGQYCVDMRDQTWMAFYDVVKADPLPEWEEFAGTLPHLMWQN